MTATSLLTACLSRATALLVHRPHHATMNLEVAASRCGEAARRVDVGEEFLSLFPYTRRRQVQLVCGLRACRRLRRWNTGTARQVGCYDSVWT